MLFHEDDRAQRLIDVFPCLPGQVNISYINSTSHIVAWHYHKKQTDYWCVLKGSLKVGLADQNGVVKFEYLSDKNARVLTIPPLIYHGYKAVEPGTILMYYVDKKYDEDDEFRVKPGYFGEKWEADNK